jgi:hypothetical protein
MEDSDHPLSPKKLTTEDADEIFTRPRSASVQSRRSSWPLLPQLQITTSRDCNTFQHNHVRSPVIDKVECTSIASNTPSDLESSISSEFGLSDKENESKYDVVHDDNNNNGDNQNDLNRRRSTLGGTRKDSAGTLVEAALDQAEAQDRHVRFPEHIAEAGSLVERMLSTRGPSNNNRRQSHHTTIMETAENDLNSIERQQTQSHHSQTSGSNNNVGGGSVLASLMKLETQRRQPSVKRRKTIKRKKVPIKKKFCLELLY